MAWMPGFRRVRVDCHRIGTESLQSACELRDSERLQQNCAKSCIRVGLLACSREMTRIAFIGAGSVEFTRDLLGDLLGFTELRDLEVALHDIDPERLQT